MSVVCYVDVKSRLARLVCESYYCLGIRWNTVYHVKISLCSLVAKVCLAEVGRDLAFYSTPKSANWKNA